MVRFLVVLVLALAIGGIIGCAGFGSGLREGLAGGAPPSGTNPVSDPGGFIGWLVGLVAAGTATAYVHKKTGGKDGNPATPE